MPRIVIKILLSILLSQIGWTQTVSSPPANDDLHMAARVVNHNAGLTDVEVTLTNASDHDFSIVVGIITNKELPAAGLDFDLIDRNGTVYRIPYMGVGFVAGRIDPLVIDLMAHQRNIFYVPAEQLVLPPKYRQLDEMLTEGASLSIRLDSNQPEATGDPRTLSQLPFWKGTAQTTIPLMLEAGAPSPHEADPKNIQEAIALLERYWVVNDETTVRAPRARLVSWIIQNQPDVCLNNPWLLFINPDDKVNFAAVRQLWLKQVEAHRYNSCFLQNAGVTLSLSDRETAAEWLREPAPRDLAELYANAIAGVTGMTPRHAATSFDNRVASSPFAKSAEQEAMKDAKLSGWVGWWLQLTTNHIRDEKLGGEDFSPIAERLFLREAELRFPQPTSDSHLRGFYAREQGKPADQQILSKAKIITLSSAELAARQVDQRHTQVEGLDHDVTVTVDVIVGIDGHVWKATAKNPPTEQIGRDASNEAIANTYRPMRVNGEPAQVSSSVQITLYASPLSVQRTRSGATSLPQSGSSSLAAPIERRAYRRARRLEMAPPSRREAFHSSCRPG
jgi:hypothetical protein